MRGNGNFYLVLGTFCLIFCLAGDYEAAAFEKKNESVSAASDSTKFVDTAGHLKTSNRLKSVDQSRLSIPEARELADLSILMEKALNSQPASGQNNANGNR
jgi:hypothetical protein